MFFFGFTVGFLLGAFIGVILMAMCIAAGRYDNAADNWGGDG